MNPRVALCLFLLAGCDSAKEPEASDKAAKAPEKAEEKAEKGEDTKPEDEGDDGKDAQGEGNEEPSDAKAPTECPKELSGAQEGDLVITKDCGVVPVTATYKVDGGTLTLEAGSTLEFADGAELSVGYYDSAKLIVNGTKDAPVKLTSKGDKAAGVWKGVRLYAKAARSSVSGLTLEYAGEDNNGGLKVDALDVRIEQSTFQHLKGAGVVAGRDASFAAFTDNAFTDVGKVAIRLPAEVVRGLGVGNTYGDAARIVVPGGNIEDEAHWLLQDTAIQVGGEVKINGKEGSRAKLTLDPGATLEFGGSGRIVTGYYAEATIEARGSADKPIVFTSSDREEPGAWRGLVVAGKGEGTFEHVEFRNGGKDEKEGVLHANGKARLSVKHATFDQNTNGVVLRGKDVELTDFSDNTFTKTPNAVRVNAAVMGGLGENNTYEAGAIVAVESGTVDKDAKWSLQANADVRMDGDLKVSKARLELPAGYRLSFKDGASLTVGYYDTASLVLSGTESAPVVLAGQRDEAGSWNGLVFHNKAAGNDVKHLTVRNAAEPAVKIHKSAVGSIDGLKCESCAGAALDKDDQSTFEVKGAP